MKNGSVYHVYQNQAAAAYLSLYFFFFCLSNFQLLIEPRHEKTCLWDLQPDKTQTGLLSYRD